MLEPDPTFLSDFFATQKITFEKCLESRASCAERAIRAHSIQNARTMQLIQHNNKVAMIRLNTKAQTRPASCSATRRQESGLYIYRSLLPSRFRDIQANRHQRARCS